MYQIPEMMLQLYSLVTDGDLVVEIVRIFAEFEGCQIPTISPPFPGRGEVGHTIDSCGHFLMNRYLSLRYHPVGRS